MKVEFKTINLHCFTTEAADIISASLFNWQIKRPNHWLSKIYKVERNAHIMPTGEVVALIYASIYDQLKEKNSKVFNVSTIARAIEEMLKEKSFFKDLSKEADIQSNNNQNRFIRLSDKELNAINVDDKHNDTIITCRICKYNLLGLKIYYDWDYVDFSIKNAWILRDFLKGRSIKALIKDYGQDAVNKIIGIPNDPMVVEQIKLKYREVERLNEEAKAECERLTALMNAKVSKVRDKYMKLVKQENDKLQEKILELDKLFPIE